MLIEIRSNVFRAGHIKFHPGLNVVLGDNNATNSIGKSNALMVIDFIFGGESFLKFNKDTVSELGEHSYEFTFEFQSEHYFFRRDTLTPDAVLKCNPEYIPIESIDLSDYVNWLKKKYTPATHDISFRAFVGMFSRVWPKENVNNVSKPLHVVSTESAVNCIDNLIKIFEYFDEIKDADRKLTMKEKERSALRSAVKFSIVEKIGKKQFSQNEVDLATVNSEVSDIKNHLAKFALNIKEVVDKDLLELKQSKDILLHRRLKANEMLNRTQKNLQENKHIRSEQLTALVEYFPEVNVQRIAEIEEFHNSLAVLLKKELKESESQLLSQRENIEVALAEIDAQISSRLQNFENPTAIIDRVYTLSERWNKLKQENIFFEKQTKINDDYTLFQSELTELKSSILNTINQKINLEINTIVSRVYGLGAKAPKLTLKDKNYSFEIFDDTGTGKAFANLVIFDLAIFSLTNLPILIHDSPLFKNVENQAVAKFINEYIGHQKQTFISLDEIEKYGAEAESILLENCVIKLSNEEVLYTKDWRKQ